MCLHSPDVRPPWFQDARWLEDARREPQAPGVDQADLRARRWAAAVAGAGHNGLTAAADLAADAAG
jgi:hypothetical protein